MELVIYQNGEEFGTAWVEEAGARLHFRAKCPFLPGIYRLYIWEGNGETLPLGVLVPENGMLFSTVRSAAPNTRLRDWSFTSTASFAKEIHALSRRPSHRAYRRP